MIPLVGIAIGYLGAEMVNKAYHQGRFRSVSRYMKQKATATRVICDDNLVEYLDFLDSLPITTGREGVS